MRTVVPGLPTPHPLGLGLPALYQGDEFAQRMAAGFDDCLAPIFATLDCFEAYLDPFLAPPDFVEWLARNVGLPTDDAWSMDQRRRLVAEAVRLHRVRGTAAGLSELVGLAAGVVPEIDESGACTWSGQPGSALPGRPRPELVVRLRVGCPDQVDVRLVDRIVAMAKPAHVPHRVEVVVDPAADGVPAGVSAGDGEGEGWP
ncbi:MAG: phage tail protein [Actinomycetes bacterium]